MELPIPPGGAISSSSAISSTRGTTITANGSANTKGSWTTIISSTTLAGNGLLIQLEGQQPTTSVATCLLVDIGIGSAGNEVVICPNLAVNITCYTNLMAVGVAHYYFPIGLPAGTRVSARYQGARTDNTLNARVDVLGSGTGYVAGTGTLEAWGPDTSASKLVELDPGGTANTKGSYSQLIASTARKSREITLCFVNPDNDSSGTAQTRKMWSVDFAIGAASSEQIIVPDVQIGRGWSLNHGPHTLRLPITVPAGVRVSARCACTVNTSSPTTAIRKIGVAAYGLG